MNSRSYRIDPAVNSSIDIIDVENGGERVNIPKDEIIYLIQDLQGVLLSKNVI